MAAILNIETATQLCSVALAINGQIISQLEVREERSHASRLTVFIVDILHKNNLKVSELDAVAVGKGPGSYTGLRIGVSTAKGLCFGANIPLIAVSTLRILYQQVISDHSQILGDAQPGHDILLCPMIDARRMEVFTCLYNRNGDEIEPVTAKIIGPGSFQDQLSRHVIFFFGSGMEKCKSVISDKNALFIPDIYPHAQSLALLAEERFNEAIFEDVAYFEPFYLKDFMATTSKKSLFV
jgi:tRNA threonylcarbamoyladenosine biosynthesis protein TsaB